MKAGILTYHNAVNYGAVLQAYALQRTVAKAGISCKIIDYKSPGVERQYRSLRFRERNSLKEYVLHNATCAVRRKKKKAFANFVKSKLECTAPVDALTKVADMDAVIVGSDQVFNPLCTGGDPSYLLQGLTSHTKKFSYAASIGKKENIDLYKTKFGIDYQEILKSFDWLSSREKDAADYISEKTGKPCDCVLDPVFLYGAEGWREFCKTSAEEYIFVYNLGNFRTLFDTVKAMKKQTGLKVVAVNKDLKGDLKTLGYENRSCASPEEFVSMLAGAKYVVTDSFHATAFSIMFRKDFYVVANSGKENTNSRLRSVLEEIGIEGRYLTGGETFRFAGALEYDKQELERKVARTKELLVRKLSGEN